MSGVVLHVIKNWTGHHIFGNYTNPMGHSHVDLPFSADMAYMEEAYRHNKLHSGLGRNPNVL